MQTLPQMFNTVLMSDLHPFIGQVVHVTSNIPENGIGTVEVSDSGQKVSLQAASDTHLPIRVGSRVVVKDFTPPHMAVVSINLPTPC